MNERFNLLKHQASVWCHENIPEQFSEETNGYGSAWEEKFAELIVRECVDLLPADMTHGPDSRPLLQVFKEHFGVAE